MFHELGRFISIRSPFVIFCWIAVFVTLRVFGPSFKDFAKGGEFNFLPNNMASRQGEELLSRAFPDRRSTSNIVVVIHREEPSGLTDDDRSFIEDQLKPAMETIRKQVNDAAKSNVANNGKPSDVPTEIITGIRSFSDRGVGELLVSHDRKASLLTIEMATDFQDPRNGKAVQQVAESLNDFERGSTMPKGLQLAQTGSATLGIDISTAEERSARNTGPLTIAMVVLLLAVIYRAPLLALVPLATLFVAVDVSLRLLSILAQAGLIQLFRGLDVYITVITYGPGVDYCLFLIARYKENINECIPPKDSVARTIDQVGTAIVASAATVICGIGMLTFAEFGKFHEAGIGISLALLITLLAAMTLTPSLLLLAGRWAFWPKSPPSCNDQSEPKHAGVSNKVQANLFQPMWIYVGGVIEAHPLGTLLVTLGSMAPFVALGLSIYGNVNYGLLESLPKSTTSSIGATALLQHFPEGITGPVEVVLQNSSVDFREEEGIKIVDDLVDNLMKRKGEMKIADIRSVAQPLGLSPTTSEEDSAEESFLAHAVETKEIKRHGIEHYVSSVPELAGHVTELDIILSTNPISLESVRDLETLSSVIHNNLPADLKTKTSIAFVGPTASVRDVAHISQSDQRRICVLVVSCVFLILVMLLRRIVLCIYLLGTVLLSYIATLGVTWLVFYCLNRESFIGLDWTVAIFLFVVLIAVGEDYNIFLVTRIREEQERHGQKRGIAIALALTGGIITSCGFIMAGTFASLCSGSLARMQQLGFALAFGVLLDTFIVRPILVPSYLMVLNDERYGNLSRYFK